MAILLPYGNIAFYRMRLFRIFSIEVGIEDDYDIVNKQEIDPKNIKGKTLTILDLGQSNSGNFGETKKTPEHNVYNLYFANQKLYLADDPLLGANGDRGSVWTRLGDKIIEQRKYSNGRI